ncbi:uncharacterized protein LOC143296453 [Babylonia areolata]|uniref:uncharacterized protein LOC143296453 n=1 Tax=Babylonia areolata TaxID=304850 RepID=UPI003FD5C363
MYLARYREMKVVAENLPSTDCPPLPNNNNTACWMPPQRCNASFLPVEERLGRVFQTQHPITKQQRMLIDSLANHPEPVDLVFITAASANHYEESQGLIRDLHKLVFPELRRQGEYTFHLYYYDLGLNPRQLKQLKTHCNCTVIPFPFSRLPHQFHRLSTCIWKPLILKAHLATSRITLWMDASVRFRTANLSSLLQQTQRRGVLVAHTSFMLPKHVHPAMLSYFRIQQPCQLASFYETAGGFVALSNDQLVHQGILDPWVACAFSPRCLCPSEGLRDCESYLPCKPRKGETYFQCHRFDQSALGILLALLFDWRVSDLSYWLQKDGTPWFAFRRGRRVKYFP